MVNIIRINVIINSNGSTLYIFVQCFVWILVSSNSRSLKMSTFYNIQLLTKKKRYLLLDINKEQTNVYYLNDKTELLYFIKFQNYLLNSGEKFRQFEFLTYSSSQVFPCYINTYFRTL